MKTKSVLRFSCLIKPGGLLLWLQIPVAASQSSRWRFHRRPPGRDGRIIYIVKAGETCTQISLLYSVSVE